MQGSGEKVRHRHRHRQASPKTERTFLGIPEPPLILTSVILYAATTCRLFYLISLETMRANPGSAGLGILVAVVLPGFLVYQSLGFFTYLFCYRKIDQKPE